MALTSLRSSVLCCALIALSLLQTATASCLNPLHLCHQIAVWVETDNHDCLTTAGDAMVDLVPGGVRDRYTIESTGNGGGWLRFWRVPVSMYNQNYFKDATGTCQDGSTWSVLNSSIQPNACRVKC